MNPADGVWRLTHGREPSGPGRWVAWCIRGPTGTAKLEIPVQRRTPVARTAFTSVDHGFKFSNAFANKVINVPSVGIDYTTLGRCGGMAFAALDYWYNRLPIPPDSSLPADGTSLSTYISKRLDVSLILNGPRNAAIAIAPDMPDLVNRGVAKAMREEEFPSLKQLIDQGKPWPIGLTRARNVAELTGGPNIGHQVVAYGYEVGSPDSKVLIYDNNHPDIEATLTFSTAYDPSKLEVRHSNGETWRCFFVESYASTLPFLLGTQADWRWCSKCQGLFYSGGQASNGSCPAGGKHEKTSSGNYSLAHNSPEFPGQPDWRWCSKCQGLFFSGGQASNGSCPAWGKHEKTSSGNYTLAHNTPAFPGQQSDWRWCSKCQGLFFSGGQNPAGKCPGGNQHDKTVSGNYTLMHAPA